jgi:hypothetical protein
MNLKNVYQPQAIFNCYPTIYDMPMLALVLYMKILIEGKHPVHPDSILNCLTLNLYFQYQILKCVLIEHLFLNWKQVL